MTTPIRIVRGKWSREWYVEVDGGPYICCIEETRREAEHVIRSRGSMEMWTLRRSPKSLDYTATKSNEDSISGKVFCSPGKLELRSSEGVFTYRRVAVGTQYDVAGPTHRLYSYEAGWRDSDVPQRICYHVSPVQVLPPEFRDLLLAMPLFWSGMSMYEPLTS